MAEGELGNLTMKQYLALTRGNQALGVVKPKIKGNVNFKIKSQFIRELREDTFFRNKNEDPHEHVERILDIVSLFNIPGVTHDTVMIRIFPITLTGATKRWVDKLSPRTVDSWDLFKKAFIKWYCPSSVKINNFKQEGDKTLYQAWERYNDLLYKCQTHDINSHQKVNIFYNGLGTMNRQLLNSQGSIPSMTPAQALTAIQTIDDTIKSGMTVGCQLCGGAHLDKEYPLNEEVKSFEVVMYGEFGRSSPFSNGAKYRVGPPRYYTCIDNRLLFSEKWPSLEDLLNKHLEDEVSNSSVGQCKAVYANDEAPVENTSSNETNKVSFLANNEAQVAQEKDDVPTKVLRCQLPLKELNPGSFTLPCTIESIIFLAMADLGVSVNVIPKSIFKHLKLANLKKTDMLVEMSDMTKRAPIRIVENVLVKFDKFLFPSDFVVIDMLNKHNETLILGRPFLAIIHAKIDVFKIKSLSESRMTGLLLI
nr:hypothetical protein [Tanacetum cinerariifolium]